MARKLRVQYPGAVYHVMSRGNRRERIFVDDQDRRKFLQTLSAIGTKEEAIAGVERYREAGATSPCIGGVPGTDFDATLEELSGIAGT